MGGGDVVKREWSRVGELVVSRTSQKKLQAELQVEL